MIYYLQKYLVELLILSVCYCLIFLSPVQGLAVANRLGIPEGQQRRILHLYRDFLSIDLHRFPEFPF